MYDLIIIGGGPAALSAARFASGKHLRVVMVYEELGGKIGWLASLVGPGRSDDLPGNELAHMLAIRTMAPGGSTINDRVVAVARQGADFTVTTARHGALDTRAVLIATGATPLPLRVPGADHCSEHGFGYSLATHAHLVAGQRVAVIGAAQRALAGIAEITASAARIYLITPYTGGLSTPLGHAVSSCVNLEIFPGYEVTAIIGGDKQQTLVIARPRGQRRIDVDRIFVALGVVPNSQLVRHIVETDADGFILVNAYHETSVPGLYAAGDVSTMFTEQVVIAIGDGARAARSAYDYLLAQQLVPNLA